jgi:hypothetical protein
MASICAVRCRPVFDPRKVAAAYGVAIELADLGDWDRTLLVAEYDPAARTIRINERALAAYRLACGVPSSCQVRAFIDYALAHELYHHREALGEIPRLPTRAQREAAADAFASERVAIDARLAAFLRSKAPA